MKVDVIGEQYVRDAGMAADLFGCLWACASC